MTTPVSGYSFFSAVIPFLVVELDARKFNGMPSSVSITSMNPINAIHLFSHVFIANGL